MDVIDGRIERVGGRVESGLREGRIPAASRRRFVCRNDAPKTEVSNVINQSRRILVVH